MKFLICFIFLSVLVLTQAAVGLWKLPPSAEHPGMCYNEGPPRILLAVGQSDQVKGQCTTRTCSEDKPDGGFIVGLTGCGFEVPPPGCKGDRDFTKPHPECCRLIC